MTAFKAGGIVVNREFYIANGGGFCPFCGDKRRPVRRDTDNFGKNIHVEQECLFCCRRWVEVYGLEDIIQKQ